MNEQKIVRNLVLIVVLAVLCVGAAELAACRIMAPDRYEEMVSPVRHLYHEKRSQVKALSEQYDAWLTEREALRVELAAVQERRALERRLLKSMVKDQQELFRYMEEHPFVYVPPAPALPAYGLVQVEGQEYLAGGNTGLFRYYNQSDERWAGTLFGVDSLSGYGCGPTALSMAVTSLTGREVDPAAMADWAASQGYAAPGSGSHYPIVQGAAEYFGLDCASVELTAAGLEAALSEGGVVVALMGPGHFTSSGHFIVLYGMTAEGQVLAADPNSRANSVVPWPSSLLVSELSATRVSGAPLWHLTVPSAEQTAV